MGSDQGAGPFGQPGDYRPAEDFSQPAFGQSAPFGQPVPGSQPGQYEYAGQPASEQFRQQYAQPAAWPGTVQPRGTNGLAIAALCCGIAQVLAGPLAGIPAIILGAVSLRQISQTGEDGRGMAITGLVLGIVGVLLVTVAILLIVVVAVHVANTPATGSLLP
jgi:Domain of unknown function (DUF4190)